MIKYEDLSKRGIERAKQIIDKFETNEGYFKEMFAKLFSPKFQLISDFLDYLELIFFFDYLSRGKTTFNILRTGNVIKKTGQNVNNKTEDSEGKTYIITLQREG